MRYVHQYTLQLENVQCVTNAMEFSVSRVRAVRVRHQCFHPTNI
jgi:hypothetical protein